MKRKIEGISVVLSYKEEVDKKLKEFETQMEEKRQKVINKCLPHGTLRVSGKQNSLFPLRSVIECYYLISEFVKNPTI